MDKPTLDSDRKALAQKQALIEEAIRLRDIKDEELEGKENEIKKHTKTLEELNLPEEEFKELGETINNLMDENFGSEQPIGTETKEAEPENPKSNPEGEKSYKAGSVVEFTEEGTIKKIDAEPEMLPPEKIENLEELLGNIEKERMNELENGPLSARIKSGVINGLEKWENFGKGEKGPKGFGKRVTKMAINLALIGAISMISVNELAKVGVTTATALGGSITSRLGTKMLFGMGLGTAMEVGGGKIPDKVKKWMPLIMGVGGVALATALSGAVAIGAAAGLSAGVGYAASKLIKGKFTNEKLSEKERVAKEKFFAEKENQAHLGLINSSNVAEIEKDYLKILKKHENRRIWGKVLDGVTKLGTGVIVSGIALEASGLARDYTNPPQAEVDIKTEAEHQAEAKTQEETTQSEPLTEPAEEKPTTEKEQQDSRG